MHQYKYILNRLYIEIYRIDRLHILILSTTVHIINTYCIKLMTGLWKIRLVSEAQ